MGQQSSSDGYVSGGLTPSASPSDVVDRFPFAAPFVTATDLGNLSVPRYVSAGQSSSNDGYTSGGRNNSPSALTLNVIDEFPFSTPFVTATDVGDLVVGRRELSGQESTTDGYSSGGQAAPPEARTNRIDRFPFSSPFATATDIGNLTVDKDEVSGHSGDSDGFVSGGNSDPTPNLATVESFPFSAPFVTATDVGDLRLATSFSNGLQN